MSDNELASINIPRVLDWFLEKPDNSWSYDDIKYLRELTVESQIRKALRRLEQEKILSVDNPRGRPRKRDGEQDRRKKYRIKMDINAFEKLFKIYLPIGMQKFLESNYTNELIKKLGFCEVYEIIKDRFDDSKFRRIASRALLNQQATIIEFDSLPEKIIEYLKEWKEIPILLESLRIQQFEIMRDFDPIEAVPFCRERLGKKLLDLHKKIGGRRIMVSTDSLIRLNELDFHLSPFTSYPDYDPIQLLFSRPFNRLYEDVYLLDESDYKLFIKRAYLVFDKFPELLSLYINKFSPIHSLEMKTTITEFVFMWNVARDQIDNYSTYLNILYSNQEGSGKYHLMSDGSLLQIIDLETGRPLIDYNELFNIASTAHGPPLHFDKPFDYLLPCYNFQEIGLEREPVPISDILEAA